MATYGSRDSGNFSYSHLQNVPYYTQIDSVTGEITLKSTTVADPNVEGAFVPSTSATDDRSIGTIDPQTGTFTATEGSGTSDGEGDFFSSPEGIKSVKESATIVSNKSQQALGADPSTATANTLKLLWPNKATGGDDTGDSSTPLASADVRDAVFNMFGAKKGTSRKRDYGTLVFPEALRTDDQDVIKFKMVEFRPREFDVSGTNMSGLTSKDGITDSMILGTATLPIPGGISDSNSVNWGEQSMSSAQAMAGALASKALESDGSGIADAITKNTESIKKAVKAEVVKAATGTDSAQYLSRTEGLVMNPNMELLFGGPQLRSFGFTFKFSPRNSKEAKGLIKIIRFFKQGMAAKKKDNGLFLKAPYTWLLEYMHKGRSHKYLNKFKECAMQSFNVNYTPDGNYSTYRDGIMTAYELTMSFGELEPVFANDYADDGDSTIGY
tara:strand:+ start:2680 stop:4002 length:1323 start_codon:yes stop_codon:yes gene_type:complete